MTFLEKASTFPSMSWSTLISFQRPLFSNGWCGCEAASVVRHRPTLDPTERQMACSADAVQLERGAHGQAAIGLELDGPDAKGLDATEEAQGSKLLGNAGAATARGHEAIARISFSGPDRSETIPSRGARLPSLPYETSRSIPSSRPSTYLLDVGRVAGGSLSGQNRAREAKLARLA